MRSLLLLSILATVGCAGGGTGPSPSAPPAETPPPADPPPIAEPPPAAPTGEDPAWIATAVEEALAWEIMPGTSGEDEGNAERSAALRTFFLAHPEYQAEERRALLAAEACGLGGTEAAHEYLAKPPPKTPVVIEVQGADWRVLVAHADHHCTSDDWSYYSNEASEGAQARGAVTGYGGATNDAVVVQSGGVELARYPLTGQGFLAAKAGAEPTEILYDPSAIGPGLDAYFGPAKAE